MGVRESLIGVIREAVFKDLSLEERSEEVRE